MDNQDKIFDKFKEAAENAAPKDFPGMESVWSRVEQKLDKKEDKKTIALWKKIAVAASLLLVISLGYQFLKTDKTAATETQEVVIQEKEKATQPVLDEKNTIPSAESGIVSNEEAVKILENHQKNKESVAIQEPALNMQTESYAPVSVGTEAVAEPVKEESFEEESDKVLSKKEVTPQMGYSSYPERESAKVAYAAAASQKAKKSSPLVVLNGNAMAHSDDVKRDKMMQAELSNVQPENVDSLVILDEPLYIIDGIYYSENDLFGKNPTSPYAPLDQQEIKTITILQDLEATSKYGEKGKKGVVIITTKTRKPTPKK
ncbi:hypothetical protein [Flavobacterium branchiicola]|uniref:TonB-dependent receptor plug domain-containing protein n=1 Tax=Flavobacterium branchiicola TaxID=1114875 RepID=A0ABV9PEL0_9FLAO|nr:hypothetical protein [Flavobacterium branchiicola]MBS7254339.1 hypothetical protein [Flavobacterium branchiicola]